MKFLNTPPGIRLYSFKDQRNIAKENVAPLLGEWGRKPKPSCIIIHSMDVFLIIVIIGTVLFTTIIPTDNLRTTYTAESYLLLIQKNAWRLIVALRLYE